MVQRMNARRKFAGSENPANAATCSMLALELFKCRVAPEYLTRREIEEKDVPSSAKRRRKVRSVIFNDEATAFIVAPGSDMGRSI